MSKSKKAKITGGCASCNGIENFYETMSDEFKDPILPNPNLAEHNFNIPFRCVVVAPSGSGKTTFTANLIKKFCMGRGTFQQITIICGDESEPIYKMLKAKSDQIIIKEGLHNLPPLSKVDKDFATLVIIDDQQNKKDQQRVEEYYIACRKKNVSIMYLAQNYYRIPLVCRNNCSYCVILKMDACAREIKAIMAEKAGGLSKEQLLNMYDYATKEKFSPLIIDVESRDKTNKFRKGFLEYLNPDNFGEPDRV